MKLHVPTETWVARHTPAPKRASISHSCALTLRYGLRNKAHAPPKYHPRKFPRSKEELIHPSALEGGQRNQTLRYSGYLRTLEAHVTGFEINK